ncbi:MAG: cytochrome d ubiquinol oxidase subunit II [Bacteroidales bacterium]|nr:cytochrome d ubiquinol oxidase subunit II [Bacteroidales bacterium]
MFETLSHLALQQYWWFIVSLLASLLVFLMFVQGGQTMIYTLGKDEIERKVIVNALGRKWEFTFTTLVTFGGAFFASFPLFYASSFGGAYWVWIAILIAFTIQAFSYEYRSKPNNVLGKKTFEVFLFLNGFLGTILIGTAVGTFFTGAEFIIDRYNFVEWQGAAYGLEAVLNFQNVALGLAVFFLARTAASLYFVKIIDDEVIEKRARKQILFNAIPFLVFFLFFVFKALTTKGYAYDMESFVVSMEPNKYLNNFIEMPWIAAVFLVGVLLVLYAIFRTYLKGGSRGFNLGAIGVVLTVLALMLNLGYNGTAFYPSSVDPQSSLTIQNASSSEFTLTVMSYVSLLVPFVLAYIYYAWRAIDLTGINKKDVEDKDDHTY